MTHLLYGDELTRSQKIRMFLSTLWNTSSADRARNVHINVCTLTIPCPNFRYSIHHGPLITARYHFLKGNNKKFVIVSYSLYLIGLQLDYVIASSSYKKLQWLAWDVNTSWFQTFHPHHLDSCLLVIFIADWSHSLRLGFS